MTELQAPVKRVLRETTTRTSIARMWSRIEARGRARPRKSTVRAWLLAAAAMVVGSLTLAAVLPRERGRAAPVHATEKIFALTPRVAAVGSPVQAPPPPVSPTSSSPLNPRRAAVREPSIAGETWQQLAARGENAKAYAELGRAGLALETQSASVADLFALADVARLSGHAKEAVGPLERILAEHATDARAPLAALTLGRVQLRSLGSPVAAAKSLDSALALGVPAGLAEDTYALLIESLSKSGNSEGARKAYSRYAAQFPDSTRAPELRAWLRDP